MERESEPCRAPGGHLLAVALPSARFARPRTGPGIAHSCPDSEQRTPHPRIAKLSGPAVRMPTSFGESWSPALTPGTSRHVHNFSFPTEKLQSEVNRLQLPLQQFDRTTTPIWARLRPERRERRITNVSFGAPEPASSRELPTGRPSLARNSLATECKCIRRRAKFTSPHLLESGTIRKKLQLQ